MFRRLTKTADSRAIQPYCWLSDSCIEDNGGCRLWDDCGYDGGGCLLIDTCGELDLCDLDPF